MVKNRLKVRQIRKRSFSQVSIKSLLKVILERINVTFESTRVVLGSIPTKLVGDQGKHRRTGPSLMLVERGSGYMVVAWGDYTVVGIYFSSIRSLAEFEIFLDTVRATVCRQLPRLVIVLDDFNATSQARGNPAMDVRGRAVQTWALDYIKILGLYI
ncbi:unnamed protein product [Euphydryas editha]|uniref:Endonuclease/exonuclease/phosphatase domain-containing protein n=1 Tax=Euphydryas editha TaxID=104508 RepID=A0AAU9UUS5_EUPED|nr:unnamed protein product [Euphydryas editha]